MAQRVPSPDSGDVGEQPAHDGIHLAEQLPGVGLAVGDPCLPLGLQLFPQARFRHEGIDRPGFLFPGGAPAQALPQACQRGVEGGADPFGFLGHLSKGKGLGEAAAEKTIPQDVVLENLPLVNGTGSVTALEDVQHVLHAARLDKAHGGQDHVHGAVARDGARGVIEEGDVFPRERPPDPGNIAAPIRDQKGHIPISIPLPHQLQHGLGASLRLLLPIRRRPQGNRRRRIGEDLLILSKKVLFQMLQLGRPRLIPAAALREKGTAGLLGCLLQPIIRADIRRKQLGVVPVRVHTQRHRHRPAHLEQPSQQPKELATGDVDAVHIQIRSRQEGARKRRPGSVP